LSKTSSEYRVDIYNADGSWAEKSGNGVRIAAMYLREKGLVRGSRIRLMTGSGISTVAFHRGGSSSRYISASLGKPHFECERIPIRSTKRYFLNQPVICEGQTFLASAVSVGNPHLVVFCRHFDFDWPAIGAGLEKYRLFPNRTNVGFVMIKDKRNIIVRDYERGVGPTRSSGTGAAAAVAVAVVRGLTDRRVNVHAPAGVLQVAWEKTSDELIITGPVTFVGSGTFNCMQ